MRKRILPPTYLLLATIVMAMLHVVAPWRRLVPFPWSLFGIAPLAVGVALDLVADADLKKRRTTVKPFELSSPPVTSGVYRLCRHPMYLGACFMLVGMAVLLGTVTSFLVVPVFVMLIEEAFVGTEERMMEEQFGDAWRAYKARVGRWI